MNAASFGDDKKVLFGVWGHQQSGCGDLLVLPHHGDSHRLSRLPMAASRGLRVKLQRYRTSGQRRADRSVKACKTIT